MNSRAYQFQLQAAEAAAAAPVVHAAGSGKKPEVVTPKAPLLIKIQAAQGTAADEPATRCLAPTMMGTIGNAAEATRCKCPECPKWFSSEKAMFGHLRKHPERGYKGATRPTTATASIAAAVAAAAGGKKPTKKVPWRETAGVVPGINVAAAAAAATKAWAEADLSTNWPASAKRGRTPVEPVPQQASGCSDEEEAAMILIELASSSRTSSETQQQQSVEGPVRAPGPDAARGHQIQTSVVEEPMLLDHPAAHQAPEAEQQIVQPENALELSAESQTTPAVKQVTDLVITTEAVLIMVPANKPIFPSLNDSAGAGDKKKAKKQRRVKNHPEQTAASTPAPLPPPEGAAAVRTPTARRLPSPASDKKHTCPVCGKSFPTHQALGGHMSSSSHFKTAKTTTSARHDDLAPAPATHNILAHRDYQSAGDGNVIIPASVGAGALQERQDIEPPRAPGALPERQDTQPPPPAPGAFQERQDAQPPPAPGTLQERQDVQPPPAQAPTTQKPQNGAPHVCAECNLVFPSGQALGGHKRKHWLRQQAKAALPGPAPAPRDFDLNEMPQEGQGENNNEP